MDVDVRQRSVLALGAAGLLVAAVTVVVVLFGVTAYPDVPRLAEQPEPAVSGQLAYLRYDREPCLHVVDGRGADREVRCGSDVEGGGLTWEDDHHLLVHRYRFDDEVLTIDVRTGEVTSVRPATRADEPRPLPDGLVERADGTRVSTTARGTTATVELRDPHGRTRTVLELEGPTGYRLDDARWTADGRWIVVRDSAERVLVLAADGDPAPRVWNTDTWDYAVR